MVVGEKRAGEEGVEAVRGGARHDELPRAGPGPVPAVADQGVVAEPLAVKHADAVQLHALAAKRDWSEFTRRVPPRRVASTPCTAAAAPARVVMHGVPCMSALRRIR